MHTITANMLDALTLGIEPELREQIRNRKLLEPLAMAFFFRDYKPLANFGLTSDYYVWLLENVLYHAELQRQRILSILSLADLIERA